MCKLRVTGKPQRDGSIEESQSEEHVSVPRAAVTKVSSCPFGGSSPKNKNILYLGWGGGVGSCLFMWRRKARKESKTHHGEQCGSRVGTWRRTPHMVGFQLFTEVIPQTELDLQK